MRAEEIINKIITPEMIKQIPKRKRVGRNRYNMELKDKTTALCFFKRHSFK